ncbi:7570_t:CDS:1, partial [Scutellospora calospora]
YLDRVICDKGINVANKLAISIIYNKNFGSFEYNNIQINFVYLDNIQG